MTKIIYSKKNNNELNNFNISVGVTDAFMEAVKAESNYDLIDPHSKEKEKELNSLRNLPVTTQDMEPEKLAEVQLNQHKVLLGLNKSTYHLAFLYCFLF